MKTRSVGRVGRGVGMRLTASSITDEQIEALRDEAGVSGDRRMVALCQDALQSTSDEVRRSGRQACAVAISEASAQCGEQERQPLGR